MYQQSKSYDPPFLLQTGGHYRCQTRTSLFSTGISRSYDVRKVESDKIRLTLFPVVTGTRHTTLDTLFFSRPYFSWEGYCRPPFHTPGHKPPLQSDFLRIKIVQTFNVGPLFSPGGVTGSLSTQLNNNSCGIQMCEKNFVCLNTKRTFIVYIVYRFGICLQIR